MKFIKLLPLLLLSLASSISEANFSGTWNGIPSEPGRLAYFDGLWVSCEHAEFQVRQSAIELELISGLVSCDEGFLKKEFPAIRLEIRNDRELVHQGQVVGEITPSGLFASLPSNSLGTIGTYRVAIAANGTAAFHYEASLPGNSTALVTLDVALREQSAVPYGFSGPWSGSGTVTYTQSGVTETCSSDANVSHGLTAFNVQSGGIQCPSFSGLWPQDKLQVHQGGLWLNGQRIGEINDQRFTIYFSYGSYRNLAQGELDANGRMLLRIHTSYNGYPVADFSFNLQRP